MDETPTTAGVKEREEAPGVFLAHLRGDDAFAPTREHRHVEALLGDFRSTLVSDGYEAHARSAGHVAGRKPNCYVAARPERPAVPTRPTS